MNEPKLARMANQVTSFFRSYPEEEAVAGIRAHLKAFWTRGMIRDLRLHAAGGAPDVDDLVRRALREAPAAEDPAHKASESPVASGLMGTDAG